MIILIPCYQPDHRLLALIEALRAPDPDQRIVLVDDGSGTPYGQLFATARKGGCDVVTIPSNGGKGAALKAGFAHIAKRYPGESVVCADCDGQHTPADIRRVAAALGEHPRSIVLGARLFVGDVPPRNRYGNAVTRELFSRVTGQHLQDTQTGLRGYPASLLPWLQAIPGRRYEYEMELLLTAREDEIAVVEVPIATVYLDGNRSTHVSLPRDPIRILTRFVKFSASSLCAFAIDAALFFLFMHLTGSLLFSVAGARVASASANFAINGRLVFIGARTPSPRRRGSRYARLAAALMVANFCLMRLLTWIAVPLVGAKLLTEGLLFLVTSRTQRQYVFRPEMHVPNGEAAAARSIPVGTN